jgi:hypothetical protein
MNIQPFLILIMIISSCNSNHIESSNILYHSDAFTVYQNSVKQDDYLAEIISPSHIKSNYQSPASETFSRLIEFKFSINEKDNELAPGMNHWLIIGDEQTSPLITFGSKPYPLPEDPMTFLPPNFEYVFQVDMTPVLEQFKNKGYYEAYDGSRVAAEDFKGFYIAGNSEPLTWDFVNLDNRGLKLNRTDNSNIYSIKLKLNPFDEEENKDKEWKLSWDVSDKPTYSSDQPIVDALYNLSLEEAKRNIEPDSTLRTGAKWGGVWTRDISYSILLAFAYHEPEIGYWFRRSLANFL